MHHSAFRPLLFLFVLSVSLVAVAIGCESEQPPTEPKQQEEQTTQDASTAQDDGTKADTNATPDTTQTPEPPGQDNGTNEPDEGRDEPTDKGKEPPQYPDINTLKVHPDARKYNADKNDVAFFVDESGTYATMAGTINTSTIKAFEQLRKDHPKVVLLIMFNVPGSDNDDANLIVARMVRKAQFATYVPSDGLIASGGTDFFLAGVLRAAESGAKIGVHSWREGANGKAATDYPKDSPVHAKYIKYYVEMGFSQEDASAFYFFTINAATPNGMHYMTPDELQKYGITTE